MNFRGKILILVVLVILVWSFVGYLPGDYTLVAHYSKNVFTPYQTLRGRLFGYIPFSIGDLLYLLGGFAIVSAIVRWVYYAIKFGLYTAEIAASVLNTVNTVLFVYLLFIISWGGNYYKPPLSEYWGLEDRGAQKNREQEDPAARKTRQVKDSAAIVDRGERSWPLDKTLIIRLPDGAYGCGGLLQPLHGRRADQHRPPRIYHALPGMP
jgi:hypothetical protein